MTFATWLSNWNLHWMSIWKFTWKMIRLDVTFVVKVLGIHLLWKHIRRFITKKNHSNAIFVIKHFTRHERIYTKKGNHCNVDFVLKHSLLIWKNAENFSTKALAMKVVLFAIWRSALAYERQKLLRFQPWGHFGD